MYAIKKRTELDRTVFSFAKRSATSIRIALAHGPVRNSKPRRSNFGLGCLASLLLASVQSAAAQTVSAEDEFPQQFSDAGGTVLRAEISRAGMLTESRPAGDDKAPVALGMFSFQDGDKNPAQAGDKNGGGGGGHEDLAKQLQNPIASLISVPVQVNWDTGIGPLDANGKSRDADKITANVQPVIPFSISENWNLISRTIVPVIYAESPAPGIHSDAGIGDTLQSLFFSPKKPVGGWILGGGSAMLIPTGTNDMFRSKQFAIGPTFVALKQSHGWTYGALVNHLWKAGGSDDNRDINATYLQPWIAYTLPTATTFAINMESTYNWTTEDWTIPVNLTMAQVVHIGKQPMQFQFGGRHYFDSPSGGPDWGVRFAVTWLFPK